MVAPSILVEPIPSGYIPKRIHWQPITKFKLKNTFFATFDPTKYECQKQVNYAQLTEVFCRSEADIKAEEEAKKN